MKEKLNNSTQFRVSKTDKIFALVKDENNKIVITMAGYAVSNKKFDTYDQAERYIGSKPYEIIFNAIYVIGKIKETQEVEQKNTKGDEQQ